MLNKRYDFILYFDVLSGNPNGDPDSGNMPRIDPQTGIGIVTDVCVKRKVRNYVEFVRDGQKGYEIFVTAGPALNTKMKVPFDELGLDNTSADDKERARQYMCARYFDVRAFGAVMDTGDYKCGQVRGPVQLCFGRSVDIVYQQEITITRMVATNETEDQAKNRTMGRKYVVPYGLYRMEGFVSPGYAQKTGFGEDDLALLWQALLGMFDLDHSAARGLMATRKLFVFEHESALGNAPAYQLFDLVKAASNCTGRQPRAFEDYQITVDEAAIPDGVKLITLR